MAGSPESERNKKATLEIREAFRPAKPNPIESYIHYAAKIGVPIALLTVFLTINGITPDQIIDWCNRAIDSLAQSGKEKTGAANDSVIPAVQRSFYGQGLGKDLINGLGGSAEQPINELNQKLATIAAPIRMITPTPSPTNIIPPRTLTPQPPITKPPVPSPTIRRK